MVGHQHKHQFGMKHVTDTSLHPKEGTKKLCENLGKNYHPLQGKDLKLRLGKGGKK